MGFSTKCSSKNEAYNKCRTNIYFVSSLDSFCLITSHLWSIVLSSSFYVYLQPVVTLCQDRIKCKFRVETAMFGEDPCPETNKYLDVTYKCRPSKYYTHIRQRVKDNLVVEKTSKSGILCKDSVWQLLNASLEWR